MQRHYNGTKFVEPTAHNANHNDEYEDEEDEAAIVLAGMNGEVIEGIEPSVFDSIIKGDDYKWDAKPKVKCQSMKMTPAAKSIPNHFTPETQHNIKSRTTGLVGSNN